MQDHSLLSQMFLMIVGFGHTTLRDLVPMSTVKAKCHALPIIHLFEWFQGFGIGQTDIQAKQKPVTTQIIALLPPPFPILQTDNGKQTCQHMSVTYHGRLTMLQIGYRFLNVTTH